MGIIAVSFPPYLRRSVHAVQRSSNPFNRHRRQRVLLPNRQHSIPVSAPLPSFSIRRRLRGVFWCVLTVDLARVVANHLLDHTLLLEVRQGFPGERAVDFQAVDENGDGDEAVRLDILLELLRGVLVENDGVLGLVLDYMVME